MTVLSWAIGLYPRCVNGCSFKLPYQRSLQLEGLCVSCAEGEIPPLGYTWSLQQRLPNGSLIQEVLHSTTGEEHCMSLIHCDLEVFSLFPYGWSNIIQGLILSAFPSKLPLSAFPSKVPTSQKLVKNRSNLVPVMAWCSQTTQFHYKNKCWPASLTP